MDTKRNIPFFNYSGLFAEQREIMAVLQDVLRRGAYILQRDGEEFENNIAEYLGVRHVIGVANGTDGLLLALRAAGVGPGDEVILPSHTFIATAAAVHYAGATPVLVECGSDHMVDPSAVRRAISAKTRVLMPVQLNGRTCNMDAIQDIAQQHGLMIIEDSAQGLGSQYKGRYAGTFGLAGMFSFYPAKILGCCGDGGAIVTNDDGMAEQLHLLRDHGRNAEGEVVAWGLNSRLDNMQAAVLNYQFAKFEHIVTRRRALATLYQSLLEDIAELTLPPAPDSDPDHFDTFQNYEIEAERRDALQSYLREAGIGTLQQWGGKAVHQFQELGLAAELPYTDQLFLRLLMLPMNPMVTDEDVMYICETIRRFYGQ